MARAKIPSSTQDQILAECRRRCALCYALNNDVGPKIHGQIAHIDRKPNNNELANLAYLCLEHANLYDIRSRQSKGFTPGELKSYKSDLLRVISFTRDPLYVHLLNRRKGAKKKSSGRKRRRRSRKKENRSGS